MSTTTTTTATRSNRASAASPLAAGANSGTLRFGAAEVKVSNLNKVLYPATGFTKGEMIAYYLGIADYILPHLRGRKLTRKRYPDGVDKIRFFEKNCPSYHPKFVETSRAESEKRPEGLYYCVVENKAALAWVANLAAIELHTLLSKGDEITRPTYMVFDLDPGAPADMLDCIRVGFRLKDMLAGFGLACFAKTSGGKGLHLYVPLNTPVTFEETKAFSNAVARVLEKDDPKMVTSVMRKDLRGGKVFVDWSQNDEHKTTSCVYTLRARERPTVSTPVAWDELEHAGKTRDASALVFEAPDVLQRVKKVRDLFAPVLKMKQKLPTL